MIAVSDLGGGTFAITVRETGDGVFEVKAVNGDTHLGGDDYDQVLIDYVADEFKNDNRIDLRDDQSREQPGVTQPDGTSFGGDRLGRRLRVQVTATF